MARAIKNATVTFGSATYLADLESVPCGVPAERETYDISAMGDTIKKFLCSTANELGEFDIEVLHVGKIDTSDTATQLTISATPETGSAISIDFGKCFLVKVDPGAVSTGDKKATQKLTFRPEGGTPAQSGT